MTDLEKRVAVLEDAVSEKNSAIQVLNDEVSTLQDRIDTLERRLRIHDVAVEGPVDSPHMDDEVRENLMRSG